MALYTRFLDDKDLDPLKAFIAKAPVYATVYIHRPLMDFESFPGWWYGAFNSEQNDQLEAIACVEGTTGHVVGLTREGLEAMGRDRLGSAAATGESDGHSHQLVGTAEALDVFWKMFSVRDNREVVVNSRRAMMGCTELAAGTLVRDIEVSIATEADFKMVSEYSAEQSLEQWGSDPRRRNKAAHEARVHTAIASGHQLTGRQGARPIFVAELVDLGEGMTLLDRVYIPRPFRRRRLVTGALTASTGLALQDADEVLILFDEDNDYLSKACEKAGFSARDAYRVLVLR